MSYVPRKICPRFITHSFLCSLKQIPRADLSLCQSKRRKIPFSSHQNTEGHINGRLTVWRTPQYVPSVVPTFSRHFDNYPRFTDAVAACRFSVLCELAAGNGQTGVVFVYIPAHLPTWTGAREMGGVWPSTAPVLVSGPFRRSLLRVFSFQCAEVCCHIFWQVQQVVWPRVGFVLWDMDEDACAGICSGICLHYRGTFSLAVGKIRVWRRCMGTKRLHGNVIFLERNLLLPSV